LSYVPHPLAPISSETLTSYWTTSAVNSVALGTRLTSKSADRATPICDLLNPVPMFDGTLNKPVQLLGCDTGLGGNRCAHGSRSTASTPLNEEGAFDTDVVEVQCAHDTEN
jgi:integrase